MTSLSVSAEPGTDPAFPEVTVRSELDVDSDEIAGTVARAVGEVLQYRGIRGGARVRLGRPAVVDGAAVIQANLRVRDKAVRMQTVSESLDFWEPAMKRLDRQIVRAWGPW